MSRCLQKIHNVWSSCEPLSSPKIIPIPTIASPQLPSKSCQHLKKNSFNKVTSSSASHPAATADQPPPTHTPTPSAQHHRPASARAHPNAIHPTSLNNLRPRTLRRHPPGAADQPLPAHTPTLSARRRSRHHRLQLGRSGTGASCQQTGGLSTTCITRAPVRTQGLEHGWPRLKRAALPPNRSPVRYYGLS
jgi:hypothetical protein